MKKHLALVLALVMVLGSFSFVSAAPDFSDVKDTTFEEAVVSLESLNVLKGYPDGTFKPANTISRAEFAAVAVRVSGLETAAMAAKGLPTGFNDVPAWHWASGYVGTAAKLGIVQGVGNGMFAPEAPVKYEEAITMIVRALGYEPAAAAKGGYPFGYLIVANEIDLLEDALGTQGTFATRGFVAQITFNALETEMMVQSGYGSETRFVVSGTEGTKEKYLIEQMGFKSVEGRVMDYDVDDLEIEMTIVEENGVALKDSKDKTYNVTEMFDFYENHGVTVKAWLDGDKVLLTKAVDKVMFDAVKFEANKEEIKLITDNKKYDLAEEDNDIIANFIVDGKLVSSNDFEDGAAAFELDYAKVVMDGNKIVWGEGFDFEDFIFVEEVDNLVITDLEDDELDLEDFLIVKDGKTISAKDIKKGDLVFFNSGYEYSDYDGFAVVANMTKEGVVTKAYVVGSNTAGDAFKLDGKTYDLSLLGAMYVDGKSIKPVNSDALEAYEDEEEKITIYLDYFGDVVLMSGEMGATSTLGAILTKDANVYSGRSGDTIAWDLVNQLGEKVKFDEVNADRTPPLTVPANKIVADRFDVVEYTLDEDGDLDEDIAILTNVVLNQTAKVKTDDRYAAGYRLQSNTVVFLVDDGSDKEVDDVFMWSDAKDFFGEMTRYDVYYKDGEVTYLVVYDSDAAGDFDPEAGVVVNTRNRSASKTEYTINIEGKEYTFDVNTVAGVKIGSIVKFDINEDMDEIENLMLASVESGTVTDVQVGAKTLKIGGTIYELTRNAVIYDVKEDDVIDLRELKDLGSVTVNAYRDKGSVRFVSYIVVPDSSVTPDPTPETGIVGNLTTTSFIVDNVTAYFTTDQTILRGTNGAIILIAKDLTSELDNGDQVRVTANGTTALDVKILKTAEELAKEVEQKRLNNELAKVDGAYIVSYTNGNGKVGAALESEIKTLIESDVDTTNLNVTVTFVSGSKYKVTLTSTKAAPLNTLKAEKEINATVAAARTGNNLTILNSVYGTISGLDIENVKTGTSIAQFLIASTVSDGATVAISADPMVVNTTVTVTSEAGVDKVYTVKSVN